MRSRSILSMLDDSVRWTGIPARIARKSDPDVDRKHQPLRWIPIWPIGYSCALFILALIWPPILNRMPADAIPGITVCVVPGVMAMVPYIYMSGPLGKSSHKDDEREAALRKDSFLFCFALLAVLNCLGQPILFALSYWQSWKMGQSVTVMLTALTLNASLFACLPTLYASWSLRSQGPTDG